MPLQFDLVYPSIFDMDMITNKMRFFLGDHWIEIGPILSQVVEPGIMQIIVPDLNMFVQSRQLLDDGTMDWAIWGPRLN